MSDRWYYTHGGATHGPVSGVKLRGLVETEGILPDDRIWPEGVDPREAIRAEAAMAFPTPAPIAPEDFEPAPRLPDWLPELAAALTAVGNLTSLPPPRADVWLPDVSRLENESRPAGNGPKAPGHE